LAQDLGRLTSRGTIFANCPVLTMQLSLRLLLCFGTFAIAAAAGEPPGEEQGEEVIHEEGSPEDIARNKIEDSSDESALPESFKDEQMKALSVKMDKNGDGKLSMQEIIDFWKVTRKAIAIAGIGEQLEEMDVNKDGKVSLEEFSKPDENPPEGASDAAEKVTEAALAELEKEKFAVADVDKDGFLDEHELPHAVHPEIHDGLLTMMATNTLKSKDTNKDGELDAKEFWDVTEESPMEAEEWKEHQADFDKVDTDKSGKLSIKELLEWEGGTFHTRNAMEELFSIADDDKDGHLTADEIGAHAPDLSDSEATMHFSEWAEHHEL